MTSATSHDDPGAPSLRPAANDRWLVSARFDVLQLVLPLAAALASLLTLHDAAKGALPLWAFLLVVVAFDVTHVWATIYLTYLDREVMKRRRALLLLTPVVSFLVAYRIHSHSASLFWSLLAYVAIFHFVQQQWGFIALYKARAGEHRRFDYYLDRWALWASALGSVLLWHASPQRQFDWFNAGESFIFRIDPAFHRDLQLGMAAIAVAWVFRQGQLVARGERLNVGKCLWMVCSWVSWVVGISLSNHPFVSAAFLNLFHGPQFLAIVWHRSRHRFDAHPELTPPLVRAIFARRRWLAFYAVLLGVALLEESLWDGVVWRVYLPSWFSVAAPNVQGAALSAWVALLSVPQISHYYLDAWIWKLDGSNPDLASFLRIGRERG